MNKGPFRVGGLVAVSAFLGFTTLGVSFAAASAFENSNGELIAPWIAAAAYLAFCQFWVAPRGRGRFWPKLLTVVASVAPLLLLVRSTPRAWGIPWVLASGCLGSVIGAMLAYTVTATRKAATPTAAPTNRDRTCRWCLLAGFILMAAVALSVSIGVIPPVLTDTAPEFNARPTGKFLGVTVVFDLLAAAILASALWRPRQRDPSSKGTLGTTAFLALFLTVVYGALGILLGGHGPALRIASVVLVLCAVCALITTALMILTSVVADRARLCTQPMPKLTPSPQPCHKTDHHVTVHPLILVSCATSLLLPSAHAQPSDAHTQQLTILRANAERGDAQAQSQLADAYFLGTLGLVKDEAECAKWWRQAAMQNFPTAQLNLANCYWKGQGVKKDAAEAMKWYRKAAEQNVPEAQYNLGVGYRDGLGVGKDDSEMLKWYRRAAEQNYADAQYNLGFCYANGQGVATNYAEAVRFYRQAAAQNHPAAQSNLGVCYQNGLGVATNDVEALKWFRRAADQNHPQAQHALGNSYIRGRGVATDEVEGVKWLRKAAQHGLSDAQYHLGLCLAFGRGVTQDYVEACAWFRLAAKPDARATKLLDDLAKAMTPEQLAAAYRRTKELRAQIEATLNTSGN